MTRTILFEVARPGGRNEKVELPVARVYNTGSATRDPEAARAHQEEVAKIGISIAFDVPSPRIYPVAPTQLVTDDEIEVLHDRTSGEAEVVLLQVEDELYVGVGSDHTDRALETISIPWSKQSCPNVMAPRIWRWEDVADRWDECVLSCEIDGRLYSTVEVNVFLRPHDMLAQIAERVDLPDDGFALFCGSYASVDKTMRYGDVCTIRLDHPDTDMSIEHSYRVFDLMQEVHEGYRVPVVPAESS